MQERKRNNEMGSPATSRTPPLQQVRIRKADGNSPPRWISVAEFCGLYQASPGTVRRWAKKGLVRSIRVPPGPRSRILIMDPNWNIIDVSTSEDPAEWWSGLTQSETAKLLGISSRALRYWEASGKARYLMVGHRKRYSISEIRRLIAQMQTGRKKMTRSERSSALVDYARWKLGLLNE